MIFGGYVERDEMRCCVQERQLWLSYFWIHLPVLCLNLTCVHSVTPIHFGLY